MRKKTRVMVAGLLVAAMPQVSMAHIVVSPDSAAAESFNTLAFWVPEGCAGSPTQTVRIDVPKNVVIAKPQPKAGWTLEVTREPLAKPMVGEVGVVKDRVAAVTWKGGRILDEQFEQFTLLVRTPAAPGPLYFPAVQTCETGENRWVETPTPDTAAKGMSHPSPVLNIVPAEHKHDHQ